MTEFNAESSGVEPMAYNFTGWGVDAKGVIPEPSNKLMKKFQSAMLEAQRKLAAIDVDEKSTPEEIATAKKSAEEGSDAMDKAIAMLCNNQPSAEECSELPFRAKQAFSKWLMSQFQPGDVG